MDGFDTFVSLVRRVWLAIHDENDGSLRWALIVLALSLLSFAKLVAQKDEESGDRIGEDKPVDLDIRVAGQMGDDAAPVPVPVPELVNDDRHPVTTLSPALVRPPPLDINAPTISTEQRNVGFSAAAASSSSRPAAAEPLPQGVEENMEKFIRHLWTRGIVADRTKVSSKRRGADGTMLRGRNTERILKLDEYCNLFWASKGWTSIRRPRKLPLALLELCELDTPDDEAAAGWEESGVPPSSSSARPSSLMVGPTPQRGLARSSSTSSIPTPAKLRSLPFPPPELCVLQMAFRLPPPSVNFTVSRRVERGQGQGSAFSSTTSLGSTSTAVTTNAASSTADGYSNLVPNPNPNPEANYYRVYELTMTKEEAKWLRLMMGHLVQQVRDFPAYVFSKLRIHPPADFEARFLYLPPSADVVDGSDGEAEGDGDRDDSSIADSDVSAISPRRVNNSSLGQGQQQTPLVLTASAAGLGSSKKHGRSGADETRGSTMRFFSPRRQASL